MATMLLRTMTHMLIVVCISGCGENEDESGPGPDAGSGGVSGEGGSAAQAGSAGQGESDAGMDGASGTAAAAGSAGIGGYAGNAGDAGGSETGAAGDSGAAGGVPDLTVLGCGSYERGTIGAIFHEVNVYCQVPGMGYYQCDELANRFMRDHFQHPNIDNVNTDFASAMCDMANAMAEYSVWGPEYTPPAGLMPEPGDLLVWSGQPGHVAVVTHIAGDSVGYVQQNNGPPTGSAEWDPAKEFFAQTYPKLSCWIHPEPSGPLPPPSGPDCGCFDGEGDYCGLAIVNHEAWFGCVAQLDVTPEYDTLYTCEDGEFVEKETCERCVTELLSPAFGQCSL